MLYLRGTSKRGTPALTSKVMNKICPTSKRSAPACTRNENNYLKHFASCKRSQVTIFIIIAIFITVLVAIFFILKDNNQKNKIPEDFENVYQKVQECLEETATEGTYFIAAHGGYYNVPFNSSIIYFTDDIPYYYLENKNLVPAIKDIESELENYISKNLESCMDLEFYKSQGLYIEIKGYTTLVNINEANINIKMLDSITINKENDTTILENIEVNIKSDLYNLYQTSIELVDSYSQKPGFICLTCMDEIANKYEVNIDSIPVNDVSTFNNDIIWYFITNKNDDSYDKLKWVFIVEK